MVDFMTTGSFKLQTAALWMLLALWPVMSFSPSLLLVALWLSFAFWILAHILKKEKPRLPDRFSLILLVAFCAGMIVSVFVTDHFEQSFRGVFKTFRQIAVFFVAYHFFQDAGNQSKLRWVVFFSFLLLATDGFYQYFFGTDFLRGFEAQGASSGRRISASFEHYGKLAAYLCAVLPVVMGYTLQAFKKGWRRYEFWIWSVLSCAGLGMLFLTRSRGAFVAFFLSWVAVLFLRRSWKILGCLFIAGAIFVAVLPKSMVIHLDADNKEQSIIERAELWHRAWDVIKARPLAGTGINTYAVAHQQFDTRKNWRVQNYYAHNGYLQTAAEIGLPGAVALVLFFLRWLWLHKPGFRDEGEDVEIHWGFFAGALTFLIFCLGDTAMHSLQPIIVFWYVAGVLGGMRSFRK